MNFQLYAPWRSCSAEEPTHSNLSCIEQYLCHSTHPPLRSKIIIKLLKGCLASGRIWYHRVWPRYSQWTLWPHLRHVTNDHGVHRFCRNPTSFKCRTRSHSTKLRGSDTFQLPTIGPKGSPPGCHDEYCTTSHLEKRLLECTNHYALVQLCVQVCVRERPRDSYSSHFNPTALAYTVSRHPINKDPQLAICHNRVDPGCCAHVTEDHSEEDNPFNICSRWASSTF